MITITLPESGRVHFAVVGAQEIARVTREGPSIHTHTIGYADVFSQSKVQLSERKGKKKNTKDSPHPPSHNLDPYFINNLYHSCPRYSTHPTPLPHSPIRSPIHQSITRTLSEYYRKWNNLRSYRTRSTLAFILSQSFLRRARPSGSLCNCGGVGGYVLLEPAVVCGDSRTLSILVYKNRRGRGFHMVGEPNRFRCGGVQYSQTSLSRISIIWIPRCPV